MSEIGPFNFLPGIIIIDFLKPYIWAQVILFDMNIWYHEYMCKLSVPKIVTWSYNSLRRIIIIIIIMITHLK